MKRYPFLFLVFFVISAVAIIGFVFVPSKFEREILNNVHQLQSRKIYIPFHKFKLIGKDRNLVKRSPMKMIVYLDSYVCTTCAIKNMITRWADVEKMEEEYNGILQFVFIVSPGNNDINDVSSILHQNHFHHSIYWDYSDAFIKANPHIPLKGAYHTFLLDEKDSVVLVGSPIDNKKINDLLKKVIKKKMNGKELSIIPDSALGHD